jgi:adenylate cyclase
VVKLYQIPVKLIKKEKRVPKKVSQPAWYTDDVIAIILASLKEKYITTNESRIHSAVFKLKKEYPEFFNDLIFSGTETHPFSKELERILFRFYQTNTLLTLNPSFDVYLIDDDNKKCIYRHLKGRFSGSESDKINEMTELVESEKLLAI